MFIFFSSILIRGQTVYFVSCKWTPQEGGSPCYFLFFRSLRLFEQNFNNLKVLSLVSRDLHIPNSATIQLKVLPRYVGKIQSSV